MLTHFKLEGNVYIDAKNTTVCASVYGDDPNNYWGHLNETVVMLPRGDNVTIWETRNGDCTTCSHSKNAIPKLDLPEGSTAIGTKKVNGVECEVWKVYKPYKGIDYCTLCVSDGLILEMYAPFDTKAAVTAYITATFTDHNLSPEYECKQPAQCNDNCKYKFQ